MSFQDLIITPIWLLIIYGLAFAVRPLVSDEQTKKYFIPALSLKIFGAIAVGVIYYFYYSYGDTINYYEHGSKWIWEAFKDSPVKAFELIFGDGVRRASTIQYSSQIWSYRDLPSYFVVRLAGFFDIFTLHTYSATASLFAVLSFSGVWALFSAFYKFYPSQHKKLAIACFFLPSVFFWGSGILKDPITFSALGWLTFASVNLFFERKNLVVNGIIGVAALAVITHIKIYITLCFLPALLLWIFLQNADLHIKNKLVKRLLAPFLILIAGGVGFIAIQKIGENDRRYSMDKLAQTAEITATYLYRMSDEANGSGYSLGDDDFSLTGMLKKTPQAIWVSLFRPHPWEARNPVMMLAAVESLFFLWLTGRLFAQYRFSKVFAEMRRPIVFFCLTFSLAFAFAIGISTYNFGSLVRYKIPLMPFYLIAVYIMDYHLKSDKKRSQLASTE